MSANGDELWAWQVEEKPDMWSMVGALLPDPLGSGALTHTPLLGRDRDIVENKMGPFARRHAESTGQALRLAHFKLTATSFPRDTRSRQE